MASGFTAFPFAASADEYPHFARTFSAVVRDRTYSFAAEFAYRLDLLLNGFEQRLNHAGSLPKGPIIHPSTCLKR